MALPEWAIAEADSIRQETEAKLVAAVEELAEDDHSQDALHARQAADWVQQNSACPPQGRAGADAGPVGVGSDPSS